MRTRPDYRKAPSASPEGSGRARDRRQKFVDALPADALEDAYRTDRRPSPADRVDPDVREEIAASVRLESELLGFWLAWQRAGGFAALEAAGWHRATIFRKVHAFRDHFLVHPDDYRPSWIRLNLPKVWNEDIRLRLDSDPDDIEEHDGVDI